VLKVGPLPGITRSSIALNKEAAKALNNCACHTFRHSLGGPMVATDRFKTLLLVVLILGQIAGANPIAAQNAGDIGSSPVLPTIPENHWAELLLRVVNDPCKKADCDPCKVSCVEAMGAIEAVFTNSSFSIQQTDWTTKINLTAGFSGVGNAYTTGNEIGGELEIKVSAPPTDLTPILTINGNTTCENLLAGQTAGWTISPDGVIDPKHHDLLKLSGVTISFPHMSINKTVTVTLTLKADGSARMFFVGGGGATGLTRTIPFDMNATVGSVTETFENETVKNIESKMKGLLERKFKALVVAAWRNLTEKIKAKTPDFNLQIGETVWAGADLLQQVASAASLREVVDGYYHGASGGEVQLKRPAYTREQLGLTCQYGLIE
jgi:hypothetical protein